MKKVVKKNSDKTDWKEIAKWVAIVAVLVGFIVVLAMTGAFNDHGHSH